MVTTIFLGLSALVWLPYGIYCFSDPAFLAGSAGVASNSATGTIELRAMYGGLQAGIGALAGLAVFRAQWRTAALTTIAFLCGGLFFARALAAAVGGDVSAYTAFALGFEVVSAATAAWLLSRGEAAAAA